VLHELIECYLDAQAEFVSDSLRGLKARLAIWASPHIALDSLPDFFFGCVHAGDQVSKQRAVTVAATAPGR